MPRKYASTASGELLLYNNNRDSQKVRRLLAGALEDFAGKAKGAEPLASPADDQLDRRYAPALPAGGLVVRVRARVLGGYPAPEGEWDRILQSALSRDNLWVTGAEHRALVAGALPRSLLLRIARFHLVDNTRGEPPMWRPDEVRALTAERDGEVITGVVHLETGDGARSYRAALRGRLRVADGAVVELELFADGLFAGEGRYTRRAPPGRFPFAVAFELADGSDVADPIPPQGSRGWVDGYLR